MHLQSNVWLSNIKSCKLACAQQSWRVSKALKLDRATGAQTYSPAAQIMQKTRKLKVAWPPGQSPIQTVRTAWQTLWLHPQGDPPSLLCRPELETRNTRHGAKCPQFYYCKWLRMAVINIQILSTAFNHVNPSTPVRHGGLFVRPLWQPGVSGQKRFCSRHAVQKPMERRPWWQLRPAKACSWQLVLPTSWASVPN